MLPVRRGAGEAGLTRCAGEAGSTRCAGASVPNIGQSVQPRPNLTGLRLVDQSSAWLIRTRRARSRCLGNTPQCGTGRVRAIHTGYTGPATGPANYELRAKFESLIGELLAESNKSE